MMPLVEFCIIITDLFIICHHRHNQMLQFLCTDGSGDEQDKEKLIKVKDMQINVSDRIHDGGISIVVLMSI